METNIVGVTKSLGICKQPVQKFWHNSVTSELNILHLTTFTLQFVSGKRSHKHQHLQICYVATKFWKENLVLCLSRPHGNPGYFKKEKQSFPESAIEDEQQLQDIIR